MKYRWLYAPWDPSAFGAIESGILEAQFSEEKGMGFITDSRDDGMLEARFVLRRESANELADPFGNVFLEKRVWYDTTPFTMRRGEPLLELISPPRGLRSFVSALAEIAEFSITIASITADVMAWKRAVEQITGGYVRMTKLRAVNIPLATNVALNAELVGADDISEQVPLLNVERGNVSFVCGTLRSKSVCCRFSLFQGGVAVVSDSSGEDPVPIFRRALNLVIA